MARKRPKDQMHGGKMKKRGRKKMGNGKMKGFRRK